jgi:hypothetical protein
MNRTVTNLITPNVTQVDQLGDRIADVMQDQGISIDEMI